MKIYISHSRDFDYRKELYEPLLASNLAENNDFILPHQNSEMPFDTKPLFLNKQCDLIIAEVSLSSTGQGIELGWANAYDIPIIAIHKNTVKISNSLKKLCKATLHYANITEAIYQLNNYIKRIAP